MRKMTQALAAVATAMLLPTPPCGAIYKCLGTNGKVLSKMRLCPEPGEDRVKLPTGPAVPPPPPPSARLHPRLRRRRRVFGERWQRRATLETSGLANAQADLGGAARPVRANAQPRPSAQTLAEQRRLMADRLGAQEVAQEMEEAEEACNARIKALEAELRKLEELNGLQQKP